MAGGPVLTDTTALGLWPCGQAPSVTELSGAEEPSVLSPGSAGGWQGPGATFLTPSEPSGAPNGLAASWAPP